MSGYIHYCDTIPAEKGLILPNQQRASVVYD
jgi:hypothetical protein